MFTRSHILTNFGPFILIFNKMA